MCKDCVIKHLSELLDNARRQAVQPGSSSIELRLDAVRPCEPFKCQELKTAPAYRVLRFPGPNVRAGRTFAIVLRLCEQILLNLQSDKVVTSRDLYYKDVSLFRNQETIVRALEKICRCFVVPRASLNVQQAPSGLVAGEFTIVLENGELQEVKRANGSTLIPVQSILHVSARRPPKYILVVEKEAVFSYMQHELPEAVILTGKGFPDRATRRLVIALTLAFPRVPVYCLVDSDPHGILILRSYECGSSRSVELQTPIPIRYLGISLLEYSEGLVQSTANDLRVAMSTLKKAWISEPKYKLYKQELQRGLFMGMKGEMNLLDQDQSKRLSSYVRQKVLQETQQRSAHGTAPYTKGPKLIVHDKSLRHEREVQLLHSLHGSSSTGKRHSQSKTSHAKKLRRQILGGKLPQRGTENFSAEC